MSSSVIVEKREAVFGFSFGLVISPIWTYGPYRPALRKIGSPVSSSVPSSRSLLGAARSANACSTVSESGSVASGIEALSSPWMRYGP